ncbi:MAG: MotA/TolQ/ExbB proton channel family protein, partial [Stellaceae bacterium]
MNFPRIAAAFVAAVFFSIAFAVPASAQAAPAGPAAQSQDLAPPAAAPTSSVDVTPTSDSGGIGPAISGISVVSLFLRADPIVKAVMLLLVLASLWSWAIIVNKWLALSGLRRRAEKFERTFWSGLSLDELYQQFAQRADHPFAAVFLSGIREWRRAFEGGPPRESLVPGINDRVEKAMNVSMMREVDGLERQLGFLATVGSTAPFVGLFGTVWG